MAINGKKVLAVTLARGGSKSIPHKNLAMINGRPLIEYTFDEALKSQYIDDYFVSTDCEKTIEVCRANMVNHVLRPDKLATDTAKSSDALIHAVQTVGGDYEYVVELMATNPFKTVEDIDACIEKLDETGAPSVVSVVRVLDNHPARVKYIRNDVLMDFFMEPPESRRQDLEPHAYVRNGSIYAVNIEFLLEEKARYGAETRPYIMPADRSVNIDEPTDLLIARVKMGEDNE